MTSDDVQDPGYVLLLSCENRPGIVAAVSAHLYERGFNIKESHQFDDNSSGRLFMRLRFESVRDAEVSRDQLAADFLPVADRFQMEWSLEAANHRMRVLIMVSRFGHCLNDLLYRTSIGALRIDIPAIVSNHSDLKSLAAHYGIPFHHIPVTPDTKGQAEEQLVELMVDQKVDLTVLARYMQVLSPQLCHSLRGRAINIHHSMLPSFKGARPYHQAFERGVKLVGATAHYVTDELDEGPIIEQEVARVDHSMSIAEFTAQGRDAECRALARAVRWHTESRVVVNGRRTVVFP
jgi:formyltetrahydrofolate deformylase